jgi:hypothetical protein
MTKKDFKTKVNVQKYGRGRDENNVYAIFFDWKSGDKDGKYFGGFKFCIFARACNATKVELFNMLYDFVTGKIEDTPWYVQLIIAMTDEQRFKIPLSSGGLNTMRKVEPLIQKS